MRLLFHEAGTEIYWASDGFMGCPREGERLLDQNNRVLRVTSVMWRSPVKFFAFGGANALVTVEPTDEAPPVPLY
jgi:hypothetical protein